MDLRKSDDQDFGPNKVFYSKEGTWLLSFDTKRLIVAEMESIRASQAEWESVSKVVEATDGVRASGKASAAGA